MKTTIELSDALANEIKQKAKENNSTMRELMEAALRLYLDQQKAGRKVYRFVNRSFKGSGVCEGITEGEWETVRSKIYEGRGA